MTPRLTHLRGELHDACGRVGRRVQFMEVCGTHTVSIFRSGIRSLLPDNLRLISGPGCPVCVTAQRHIDAAIQLATRANVIIATYGDMLRVPGDCGSLEQARAAGADVRVINSARTALELARENRHQEVVFLAVGFETTAPATAATIIEARRAGIWNFTVLMCHKLVVPAMLTLLDGGRVALDGFLCPGHISVIIGAEAYRPIVERHHKACVVAGFEPEQILAGLVNLVRQVESGRAELENVYAGVVSSLGNLTAQSLMKKVFMPAETAWRGLGTIPASGLELSPDFRGFDALARFGTVLGEDHEHPACRCGEVISGLIDPNECALFGTACTPLQPYGPCMVSSEGTCAAWYRYNAGGRVRVAVGAAP